MTRSLTELHDARMRLADVAVAQERLRLARDLHDLLGLSLSAVTLKSELAHRLIGTCPERARAELVEILDIARRALADVRMVASGCQELSLPDECRIAESLLTAAEVRVRLEVCHGELSGKVGSLLATVLREGVTNVLRHSKGEHCVITVAQAGDTVSLDIVNDGVHPHSCLVGTGIHNLTYRVRLAGGEVTAGVEPDGRFRLRARVPS
jgi:signal transduction histidine kinase